MTAPGESDPELARLRELLLAHDRAEVEALRARVAELEHRFLTTPERSEAVAEVLPAAIHLRRASSDDLTGALMPDVEQAMHESIQRDPEVMAKALYPVMGPAIRKMIGSMFSLDNLRPGRTYRIDQAFIIHRESALPLVVYDDRDIDETEVDADMVSGMMEVLRSFVQDAFSANEHDGLRDLRVGDVMLWIEWGPEAVLAVVAKGFAPDALRLRMQEALEAFHLEYAAELGAFDGDDKPYQPMQPTLEELADELTPEPSVIDRVVKMVPVILGIIVLLTILVVVGIIVVIAT